jgi:hypothetical protein
MEKEFKLIHGQQAEFTCVAHRHSARAAYPREHAARLNSGLQPAGAQPASG